MDAKELLDRISEDDIVYILSELGSATPRPANNGLLFQTVCHCGSKHKLHYHKDTKTFFCYSECGNLSNVINLVMVTKSIKFSAAIKYICDLLNIQYGSMIQYGFKEDKVDNSFINKFAKKDYKMQEIEIRNESVLNNFWNIYDQSWINDGISISTMKQFGIMYDILNQSIIIPHRDINNNLIGIRARNLKRELIDAGMKYIPITVNGVLYNYPTSLNLFGLNVNRQNIRKYKRVIIGESEKFVMQMNTFYEGKSIAAALNGSALSQYQIDLLLELGVETVVLALDKEFENEEEERRYKEKITHSFIKKLIPYFTVEIIWDQENLLDLKDAPTDKGKEVYEKLYNSRIVIG